MNNEALSTVLLSLCGTYCSLSGAVSSHRWSTEVTPQPVCDVRTARRSPHRDRKILSERRLEDFLERQREHKEKKKI
jgi:hypothetical protein